jgi:hypothetical protein
MSAIRERAVNEGCARRMSADKDIWVTEFVKELVLRAHPPMAKKSAMKAALNLWPYRNTQAPDRSARDWAASRRIR